jgi:hypothetical protein
MITKLLVSAAIVFGSLWGAAAASADPSPSGTEPNPFANLTCNCQETTPADSAALSERGDHRARNIQQLFDCQRSAV